MEFKIVEKPAFNLVGVSGRVPMQFEGVNDGIVKLANSITEDQRVEMRRIRNVEPLEIISASYDADENFLKEEGDLTHLIGVLTTEKEVGEGLSVIPVEACTWAVFPNEGPFPETLQNTMAEIYAQWLPVSGYEVLPLPTFSFTRMDAEKIGHAYSEIWTPVKKI